jgi:predicted deacetylase
MKMGVLESIGLFVTDIRLEAAIRITIFSVLGFSLHFFVSPVCLMSSNMCFTSLK